MILKPLPSCKFTEASLLGSIILNTNLVEKAIMKLTENEFYFKPHKEIFNAICVLSEKNASIDVVGIGDILGYENHGAIVRLSECVDGTIATTTNIDNQVNTLKDRSFRRSVIMSGSLISTNCYNLEYDKKKIMQGLESMLSAAESNTNAMNGEDIVVRMDSTLSTLINKIEEKETLVGKGFSWWPNFSNHFRLEPGTLVSVGGIPSHGKTTVLQQMVVNSVIDHGLKWAIFNPENKPYHRHARPLIQSYCEKSFLSFDIDERITVKDISSGVKALNDFVFFINPPDGRATISNIVRIVSRLNKSFGIDVLLIDPWNKTDEVLLNKENETKYIRRKIKEMTNVCRSEGWTHINVVHPQKLLRPPGKTVDSVPRLYDMYGSAAWADGSDMAFTVYRDFKKNVVYIHHQKTKFDDSGKEGVTMMRYSHDDCRLHEITKDEISKKVIKEVEDNKPEEGEQLKWWDK